MNEQEALSQMVSPGMKRRGIWRGGVLQVLITRACDLACTNCTQASHIGGRPMMMTAEQAEVAFESVKDAPWVIGLFGGSPSLNTHFDKICEHMRRIIPEEQRGIWSNHPHGKGSVMRQTFNPYVSNLNVHLSQEAYDEFCRDWPESKPVLKGLDQDSRHGPPWVAMKDLDVLPGNIENTEENRWDLIASCDINRLWSSLIGVWRGELRAWFCEIAGAQAMLHENDPDYPDTGVPVVPGWWKQGMDAFAHQARKHCHECGIPLRGFGDLAMGGTNEQVSPSHAGVYKLKRRDKTLELVTRLEQLGEKRLTRSTDYIQNGSLPIIQ